MLCGIAIVNNRREYYRMDLVADILAGKEISGILLDERIKDII